MSIYEEAREAFDNLLWELPAEFSETPDPDNVRDFFSVMMSKNVLTVWECLDTLRQYFDTLGEHGG